jgi:hypothetical protein
MDTPWLMSFSFGRADVGPLRRMPLLNHVGMAGKVESWVYCKKELFAPCEEIKTPRFARVTAT